MTTAQSQEPRSIVAARIIGVVEDMLAKGLVHPSRQVTVARLIRQYDAIDERTATPEDLARAAGRTLP